jgi:hypothetical protein
LLRSHVSQDLEIAFSVGKWLHAMTIAQSSREAI